MLETISGLPLHPLVVHAVVVFLPLASVAVLATAVWPRLRRWAGPLPLILAVGGTVLIPVATESGEWFQGAISAGDNPQVQVHASLGNLMLYWGIGLVVAAAAVYWLHLKTRAADSNRKPAQALVAAIAVFAAVASIGTVVHVYRVGDSGSEAAWGWVTEQG